MEIFKGVWYEIRHFTCGWMVLTAGGVLFALVDQCKGLEFGVVALLGTLFQGNMEEGIGNRKGVCELLSNSQTI